jgi:hypothetical protein
MGIRLGQWNDWSVYANKTTITTIIISIKNSAHMFDRVWEFVCLLYICLHICIFPSCPQMNPQLTQCFHILQIFEISIDQYSWKSKMKVPNINVSFNSLDL